MIEKFQQFLAERSHGIIRTRKEAVYILVVIALALLLTFSLVGRAFVA